MACGDSIENKIDQLSSGGEDLERAKQELLLALALDDSSSAVCSEAFGCWIN